MNIKNKQFISWLFNRLQNKHKEDLSVIQSLGNFVSNNIIIDKHIDISVIDKVCKKFFPDFDIDRVQDINIGFIDKERDHMRNMIIESIKELSKS